MNISNICFVLLFVVSECLLHNDEALILLTLTNPGQAKLSVQEHCSLQVKIN